MKINILIADDHKLIRDGIKNYLNDYEDFDVIAEAGNGKEVLEILKSGIRIDIILMDINMPVMDGLETTQLVLKEYPDIKILALTMINDKAYIKEMIDFGALGYVLKDSEKEEIELAIRTVSKGIKYVGGGVMEILLSRKKPLSNLKTLEDSSTDSRVILSNREKEIMQLILKGYSNTDIASQLFISTRTVEAHKRNLIMKTGVKNLAGLIVYVLENNLIK